MVSEAIYTALLRHSDELLGIAATIDEQSDANHVTPIVNFCLSANGTSGTASIASVAVDSFSSDLMFSELLASGVKLATVDGDTDRNELDLVLQHANAVLGENLSYSDLVMRLDQWSNSALPHHGGAAGVGTPANLLPCSTFLSVCCIATESLSALERFVAAALSGMNELAGQGGVSQQENKVIYAWESMYASVLNRSREILSARLEVKRRAALPKCPACGEAIEGGQVGRCPECRATLAWLGDKVFDEASAKNFFGGGGSAAVLQPLVGRFTRAVNELQEAWANATRHGVGRAGETVAKAISAAQEQRKQQVAEATTVEKRLEESLKSKREELKAAKEQLKKKEAADFPLGFWCVAAFVFFILQNRVRNYSTLRINFYQACAEAVVAGLVLKWWYDQRVAPRQGKHETLRQAVKATADEVNAAESQLAHHKNQPTSPEVKAALDLVDAADKARASAKDAAVFCEQWQAVHAVFPSAVPRDAPTLSTALKEFDDFLQGRVQPSPAGATAVESPTDLLLDGLCLVSVLERRPVEVAVPKISRFLDSIGKKGDRVAAADVIASRLKALAVSGEELRAAPGRFADAVANRCGTNGRQAVLACLQQFAEIDGPCSANSTKLLEWLGRRWR